LFNGKQTLAVLVVEDEWLVREAIASYLRDGGCFVLEASDAETALALVESGERVDVLLTDIALGGRLDGWDLGETVRAWRPAVGVIYTSGAFGDQGRPVAGSLEFNKPYSPAKVLYACRCMANGESNPGARSRL
jgi:CheY-like chemotaxis protein